MNAKEIASKIVTGILVITILFIAMKGCFITVWISPKTPEIYSIHCQDGRDLSMIFLPNNETMIWYFDSTNETIEGVLTKMRGTYGTHYFWRIWHVEGPGITYGYRIYPSDSEPVSMEITYLEKYMSGNGNPAFPEKGDSKYGVLLFTQDSVKFEDMWLERDTDDPVMVQELLDKLGGSQE